uniref:Uncharacterized protein n=1 Tax=Ignisphaera aggregans TaxID=334771 RepID=A0A7C2ZP96_9CREN
MNMITLLHSIGTKIQQLVKELESRGMLTVAQNMQNTASILKRMEKICIYTRFIVSSFKSLNSSLKDATKSIGENAAALAEVMNRIAQDFANTLTIVEKAYVRTKIVLMFLVTLYVISFINIINTSVSPAITAFIWTALLLSEGLVAVTLLMLDLSTSAFVIPLIPATTAVASLFSTRIVLVVVLVLVNVMLLAFSLFFVFRMLSNYKLVKQYLEEILESVEGLLRLVRESSIQQATFRTEVNEEVFAAIYGDKAYELIKYLNDMQKLAKQQR